MTTGNWLTALGITVTLLTLLVGFTFRINTRVSRIEEQLNLIWKVLDPRLADCLHAPTHYERDELGDKWVAGTLTAPERERFLELLKEAVQEDEGDPKRAAAASLIAERVEMSMRHRKKWRLWHGMAKCA